MSEPSNNFESRARVLLEESATRLDGRTLSRLNQARHAALDAARGASVARGVDAPRGVSALSWFSRGWLPAGATAAVAVLALILWTNRPNVTLLAAADSSSALEDVDLLADNDALDLAQDGDADFYEWAAAQTGNGDDAVGT